MRAKESRKMYLEVILKLEERRVVIHSIDIAKEFHYSKPSVSRAMSVLKKEGFITRSTYGAIALMGKGHEKAQRIYKSHRLVADFFVESLTKNRIVAEEDACKIEHIISNEP